MKLSYSSYMRYKTCPLWFRLEREYPLRGPMFAELLIGQRMHRYFYDILHFREFNMAPEEIWNEIKGNRRLMHRSDFCQEFEDFQEMQSYYASLKNTLVLSMDEEEYVRKIERIIEVASQNAHRFRGKRYRNEVWLQSRVGNGEIYGIIDLLSQDDVVELKTGRIEGYDLQLEFYSLLFYLKYYRVPRSTIFSLYTGEMKNVRFSSNWLEKLYNEIKENMKNMEKGVFTPRRGEWCRYCPYRSLCEEIIPDE